MTENDREKEQVPVNPVGEQFDAASKSLTDALRLSFAILKVIMVILIVLFARLFKKKLMAWAITNHAIYYLQWRFLRLQL